jgi:hypothetical protein
MLPSKLLYQNKIESSYARNFISKIQPQNTTNYSLGQTTIFNIPCMANQVLSGVDSVLNVRLCLRNGSVAGDLAAGAAKLDGAGIVSAIQRVRIFHGSQLLSDIDSYGNLMNLLYSAQCSSDLMKNKYALLMGSGQDGAGIGLNAALVGPATDFSADNDVHNFSIPLTTIFNLTNNYVPCWALTSSSLRLEIQWATSISQFVNYPNTISLVPAAALPALFSDVSLTCNFMELSDSAMAIIQNSLQGNPVEWVCTDYSNYIFNTTLPQSVTNISMAVPAKYNSLKSLLFTFRPQTSAAGTGTAVGNDRFGSESIKFKLSEYDARIGSRVIPSDKPNTVSQFYSEFLRAISSVGNLDHETNITRTMYSADVASATVSSKFCVGFDLESYSAVDLSKTYQGLNTSTDDIFANFRFGAQTNATNIRIDAYASFDKLIICQNGGVVGVSY